MVNLENIKDIESAKNEKYNGRDLTENEKRIFDYLLDYLCDYSRRNKKKPLSYLEEVKQVAEYLDLVIWSEHNKKVEKENIKLSRTNFIKLTNLVISENEYLEYHDRSLLIFIIKAINTNNKQFGKAFEKEIDKWKNIFEKQFVKTKSGVKKLEENHSVKKVFNASFMNDGTVSKDRKFSKEDEENAKESQESKLYEQTMYLYNIKKQIEKSEKVINGGPRKIHWESFSTIEEVQQLEELINEWESDWSDISPQFKNNPSLVKSWTEKGFNKQETKEWTYIGGLKPAESEFAQFLRDIRKISAWRVSNEKSIEWLREKFQRYQTKIEIPPK